jgi:DNA-binding PadR family transcriptional regulator
MKIKENIKEFTKFIRALITPSKPSLQVEIEIVQFLAQHGESVVNDIHEYLTRDFDFDNIKPYTYVSFGHIYQVLITLEDQGVLRSRFVMSSNKRRLAWTLTGRGPKKFVYKERHTAYPQALTT